MAIVLDVQSVFGASFFSDTTDTTATVGTLSNGIMVIRVTFDGGTPQTPTVNASSTGVTLLQSKTVFSGDPDGVSVYYLLAPSAGSTTVVFQSTGASFVTVSFATYSGVAQTSIFGTPVTADGGGGAGSSPITVGVPTTTGDLVLDAAHFQTGGGSRTATVGAGQTERVNNSGDGDGHVGSEETAAGATTTMSWTLSASSLWATIGFVMNAAAGGATTAQLSPVMGAEIYSGGYVGRVLN